MTPDVALKLDAFSRSLGLPLSEETRDRLGRYLDLLRLWNERLRLTGDRGEHRLALHHVSDSMALSPVVPIGAPFVDIGSGAGLPGLVLAIVRPDLRGTLIDSRRRPAGFLREAARRLQLPHLRVVEDRAERFAVEQPVETRLHAVAVSRAIRAGVFLRLARPLLQESGTAVVMHTPRGEPTTEPATTIGPLEGWTAAGSRDYVLPDGTPRRLLLFRRVC